MCVLVCCDWKRFFFKTFLPWSCSFTNFNVLVVLAFVAAFADVGVVIVVVAIAVVAFFTVLVAFGISFSISQYFCNCRHRVGDTGQHEPRPTRHLKVRARTSCMLKWLANFQGGGDNLVDIFEGLHEQSRLNITNELRFMEVDNQQAVNSEVRSQAQLGDPERSPGSCGRVEASRVRSNLSSHLLGRPVSGMGELALQVCGDEPRSRCS